MPVAVAGMDGLHAYRRRHAQAAVTVYRIAMYHVGTGFDAAVVAQWETKHRMRSFRDLNIGLDTQFIYFWCGITVDRNAAEPKNSPETVPRIPVL